MEPFYSKQETTLKKAAQFIYSHVVMFGLTMHIRKGGSKSKTEAMHFPVSLQKYHYTVDTDKMTSVQDRYITRTKKF